jgi:hypothetical protein
VGFIFLLYILLLVLLTKFFNSLGVENALAFDAENFSPILAADFLANLTKSITIYNHSFHDALVSQLQKTLTLGKHTNIIHITKDSTAHYKWAHQEYQPWGHRLPLQCPQCGILRPWVVVSTPGDGYLVECRNANCASGSVDGKRPKIKVDYPKGATRVNVALEKCCWLRVPVLIN